MIFLTASSAPCCPHIRAKINEVYQDDCKTVHGLAVRPSVGEWNETAATASLFEHPRKLGRWVQNTKGMSNFSTIKFGDDRIQRVSSSHREEFRSPVDRVAYGKPVMDPSFRNVKSLGYAGVGLFTKSFLMADEVKGDESASVGLGSTARYPAATTAEVFGHDNGRTLRVAMYRRAMQDIGVYPADDDGAYPQVAPSPQGGGGRGGRHGGSEHLSELEALFRQRLITKSCKGVGQFHLPSMFSYLDRSGRGGFDLEDFRMTVEAMVLDFSESQTIALFAK